MIEMGTGCSGLLAYFHANCLTALICDQICSFEDKHSQNQELASHLKRVNGILSHFKEEGNEGATSFFPIKKYLYQEVSSLSDCLSFLL